MRVKYQLIELSSMVIFVNQVLAGIDRSEGLKLCEQLFRLEDAKNTSLTPKEVMEKLERLVAIYTSNSYDFNKLTYESKNHHGCIQCHHRIKL